MREAFALYLRYVAISVRAQLQYRAALVMQMIGQLLVTGIEFIGVCALFARFGSLRGWTLHEVAFLYGMVDVAFALADAAATGFDRFDAMIRAGDFDRLLLRPRSTVLQLAGQELALRRAGRLLQGLAVLAWASHAGGIAWSAGKVALLVAAVAGGACLFFGLVVLQATSAFWTVETIEVWNAFTYGGNYAGQYPMSIYRPWFRRFFTAVVPLACVGYLPALTILGHVDPIGLPTILQWIGPLAGVAFLAAALGVWRLGVRHYTSTGS